MKNLICTVLVLISFACSAQVDVIDSLSRGLQNHPERDTVRFKLLVKLAEQYLSQSDTSKILLDEALAIVTESGYQKGIAETHYYLTHYYWYRTDMPKALEEAIETLRAYEKLNDSMGLFEANLTLAGVYMSLKDFEKANVYMDETLWLAQQNKSKVDFGELYKKVAFLKLQQDKNDEGIEYLNKSLAIMKEQKDLYGQAGCHFLLAKAHHSLGKIEDALDQYENSIRLAKASNHPNALSNIVSCHEGMGELYTKSGRFDKASSHLDTAMQLAKRIRSPNMMMRVYRDLTLLNESRGDFREALHFERLNRQLTDSIDGTKKSKQVAEAQAKFESEKKEQAIRLLEQESNIQALWRNSLMAGLALTIIASIIIYALQRSRARHAGRLLQTEQLLNQQMQETDKLKSRFFANISHEFRTPLTLILSPLEEKLNHDLPQKDKIVFQSMRRSANRLLDLINQLLELSKLESGFMKLENQPGNIYNFIVPVISAFDSLADVSQVNFSREVSLPETNVMFDADKLEKIVNNLLSNAFRFSPRGEKVEIRVVSAPAGSCVRLTIKVRNTGTVIPPDILNKIFEPFFQGSSPVVTGVPGTGLGLSLVRELVRLYGGEITVESTKEYGTEFTVAFDLERSSDQADVVRPGEVARQSHEAEEGLEKNNVESDEAKETILVVEDNAEVRSLIRSGLEGLYNVIEVSGAREALDMSRERAFDLVLSDLMMPFMNGIELCQRLKNNELTSHLPVILLTARADHESKLEGLQTGADDYLIKPFNMQELQARIRNLIEQRKRLIQKYNQRIVIQPHEVTVTPLDEQFIRKAIQAMENNLDNTELSVDDLSEELGMSRTNLHRKLKALTAMSPGEFIQDFRLRRAAQLIEKKADTIARIAYTVGFNDQSYFTKCFKKKFGKTPTEFSGKEEKG